MAAIITRESPDSADAVALITELEAHLEPLYPARSRHGYCVERLIAQGVAFFVLRDDGVPAGCAGIQLFGTEYGEIKRMYVRPQFRGLGHGRRLLDHLTDHARAQGIALLRLETGIHQPAAIRLYERMGFQRVGPFGDYVEDPLCLYYEKRILPRTIRLATPDDARQIQEIYAPYCATPISFETEPPSVEEVRGRLTKVLGQYPWLLCANGAEVLGYVYATQHRERAAYRWSVDTAVYVRQGWRRQGVGRALYTSLLAVLPLQGYVNAYAGVTLPNPDSVGLHEALGFEPVGVYRQVGFKCGAWHDVAWFQRLLQPRPGEPPPPRRLEEVRHTTEWVDALGRGLQVL
jgi:phosphinothricin acetyltransferase